MGIAFYTTLFVWLFTPDALRWTYISCLSENWTLGRSGLFLVISIAAVRIPLEGAQLI